MAVFKNDTGTKIIIDVGVDASDISLAKIYAKKPDGNTIVWNASIEAGTTNIYYITQEGDLNIAGRYELQPYLELSSGWKGRGEIIEMFVGDII